MIPAGERNTPIVFYKPIQVTDAVSLEVTTSFALVGTDWAAVEWESGKLFEAAKKLNAEVQGVVRTLYRRDVRPGWRIKLNRRWIQIMTVSDYKEKHEELWLNCKEAQD
jgi:SPP1 family predicted phage head-tail adaptor